MARPCRSTTYVLLTPPFSLVFGRNCSLAVLALIRMAVAYIIDVYTWRHHEDCEGVQERQQPGRQNSEGVSPRGRRGRDPEAGWLAAPPAQKGVVGGAGQQPEDVFRRLHGGRAT